MRTSARRSAWVVADQILSSGTNFGLSIVAARSLSAESFGGFALAMTVYFLAVGASRALCGDVVLARHSGASVDQIRSSSAGAALVLGLFGSVVLLLLAIVLAGPARSAVLALAVVLPGLLVQDAQRYLGIAAGAPATALANDVVWTLAQVLTLSFVLVAIETTVASFVLAWGLAACVAAGFGMWRHRIVPAPRRAARWLSEGRSVIPGFVVEFVATTGAWQITLIGVGGILGLTALGGLRGCQVLYGPLHVVNYGARLTVVPEAVRGGRTSPAAALRLANRTSIALGATAVVATSIIVLVPSPAGTWVLGDTWPATSPLVLPFGLFMVTQGMIAGASVGLRVQLASRAMTRAAAISGLGLVAGALLAAAVAGVLAVAWVLFVAGCVGFAVWWVMLRDRARRVDHDVEGELADGQ